MKENLNHEKQQNLMIDKQKIAQQSKKFANRRAPGPDGVQGYWFKNFSACYQRIADQLNEILKGDDIHEWMTYHRTVLCLRNPSSRGVVDNFRPISCLPVMWKLMTEIIAESLYSYLDESNVLSNEQKGCRKTTCGTKDQLLIDKMILEDRRKRKTNLVMAWVDY